MTCAELLAVRGIDLYWAQRRLETSAAALGYLPDEGPEHDRSLARHRQDKADANERQARFVAVASEASEAEFDEAMTQLGEVIAHDDAIDRLTKIDLEALTPCGVTQD